MSMTDTNTPATTDDVAALRIAAAAGQDAIKQVAFLKAGVDISDPLRANLMNTYTGDNDPAKVIEYLTGFGMTPAVQAVIEPAAAAVVVDDGQQAMRDAINGTGTASDGAGGIAAPGGNVPPAQLEPVAAAWKEFYGVDETQRLRNRSVETRQLVMIDKYIEGAVIGTPGMRFDADEWRRERSAAGHDFRPMHMQGQPLMGT